MVCLILVFFELMPCIVLIVTCSKSLLHMLCQLFVFMVLMRCLIVLFSLLYSGL